MAREGSAAAGSSVKGDPATCSIAAFAAAMASLRYCMLLTARKLVVPRFSAVISMSVMSTSMIIPTTSAVPRWR